MHGDDDLITITVRCRVKGCPYQKTYLLENPSDLMPIPKEDGWRFDRRVSEASRFVGSIIRSKIYEGGDEGE
jgi:hypothetical protein